MSGFRSPRPIDFIRIDFVREHRDPWYFPTPTPERDMSDCDEGDSPLAGLFCPCGLVHRDRAGVLSSCPDCGAPWPSALVQRWPYDGGPEIRKAPGELSPREDE